MSISSKDIRMAGAFLHRIEQVIETGHRIRHNEHWWAEINEDEYGIAVWLLDEEVIKMDKIGTWDNRIVIAREV